jgi:hypothetical protein
MAAQFLSNLPIEPDSPTSIDSSRERIKLIIIGSAEGVREKIHLMHQRHVADAGSWSRLLPVPNSDEVMSILMLYRQRE